MIEVPCRTCPDKGCGRHSKCEKYLAYRSELDALRKRQHKNSQAGEFLAENAYRTMRRNGKR